MMGRLALLFVVVPALELYLILQVGSRIGALPTAISFVLTGLLGASLARREGASVLGQLFGELSRGVPPADRLVEGALVLGGAILLITPGYITDLVGFLCILPWTRPHAARLLRRWITARYEVRFTQRATEEAKVQAAPPARPASGEDPFSHPRL
jgi:UPF0716 protein FxsA